MPGAVQVTLLPNATSRDRTRSDTTNLVMEDHQERRNPLGPRFGKGGGDIRYRTLSADSGAVYDHSRTGSGEDVVAGDGVLP